MIARDPLPPKWRRGMYAQTLAVACPYCHMPPGKQCRTWKGAPAVNPHDDRYRTPSTNRGDGMSKWTDDPKATIHSLEVTIHRVRSWALGQATRTDDGNVLGLSVEQTNSIGKIVLALIDGADAVDELEAQEGYVYDRGGLRQIVDDAEESETVDLLRQMVETLERIEGHVAPKVVTITNKGVSA